MKRAKKDLRERVSTISLNIIMTVMVFVIFYVALLISGIVIIFLIRIGVIGLENVETISEAERVVAFMAIVSLVIGTGVSGFISRYQMRPVHKLVNDLRILANGNYKNRIHYKRPYGDLPPVKAISDSYNILAEELEHTEMLRSDFINNFSHEFKTPISAIAGFANLVRNGNLTEEEQNAYLEVIESESRRLAQLATNILNLTRVENQTILTEKATFNLSEQVRSCFVLLEDRWSQKELDFDLEFDEHTITANEELLKHVWTNLLDNAIKFTPDGGRVEVTMKETAGEIIVCVSNTGNEIPEEAQNRIFNKFYQADESHASAGNGIGLSVVKRVVELHDGDVEVESKGGITSFRVFLPK